MGKIAGIDLGTSTSEIAVFIDGKPCVIPNHLGEYITPSVAGISDEGKIIVGREAKEQILLKPEDTVIEASGIEKQRVQLSQLEKLKSDNSFHHVFAGMFDFETHKCGRKDCLDCEFEQFAFEMDVIADIHSLRRDILRLKTAYPELYAMKSEFFDSVLNPNKLQNLIFSYKKRLDRYMRLCPEKFSDEDAEDAEDDEYYYPQQPVRRDEGKVGRNDPCPCGSGKKYKKCCGR